MTEPELHRDIAWGLIAIAVPTLAYLLFRTATYGRHARPGWGPTVSPRVGWILMESPAVLLWLGIYLSGSHRFDGAPLAKEHGDPRG